MFDLTVAKNELLPRILMVAGAVDKRQSLAVLSNILVRIDKDSLMLTATDLEIEISARVPCQATCSDGQITVPAKKFIDILRSLDDDAVPAIKSQDDVIVIKAGRSQFKLATLPAAQFPSSEQESRDIEFILPRSDLIHLLHSTHFAMSQQDVRVFLNGLFLEFEGSEITAVAADGHRMAICRIASPCSLMHHRLLLPRKSVTEMLRMIHSVDDESLTIQAGNNSLRLTTRDYQFTTRLIDARYPPYLKAIPKDSDKFVLVDKDSLKRALSRILILAHEKSRGMLLQISSSGLTLTANNQEQEEATETVEAQVDGNDLKIGINAGYLHEVLQYLSDSTVRLSLSGPDRSILVEPLNDECYQYIIMTMKL